MSLSCRSVAIPAETRMGPVHVTVADLARSLDYYRRVVGLDVLERAAGRASLGANSTELLVLVVERVPQAAFRSAGGYHHHVGANTWESAGAGPPPEGTAALRHATVVLPSVEARDEVARRVAESGQEPEEAPEGLTVRDPSGNRLVLAA